MTVEEAERLLALSRLAEWAFPTSFSSSILVLPGADEWVELLASRRDGFARAARFFVDEGREDAAAELAANVWRLWLLGRDLDGGRAFLSIVLDGGAARPSRASALALYADALLAIKQGDLEASRRRSQAALDVATEVDDLEGKVLGLLGLSRVAFEEGRFDRARSYAAEAFELAGALDPAMRQAPLHMLAQAERQSGQDDRAAALFEESLALNRRIGDPGMVAVELHNLGHVEIHRGNVDAAERHFAEAAERGDADDPFDRAIGDLNAAALAFARGDRERAATLHHAAGSALQALGEELPTDDRLEFDRLARLLADGSTAR